MGKKDVNILRLWWTESDGSFRLDAASMFNILFVVGVLLTLFFCLSGITQNMALLLGRDSPSIIGFSHTPAWIPAIAISFTFLMGSIISGLKS